jgi:hypothetical protein
MEHRVFVEELIEPRLRHLQVFGRLGEVPVVDAAGPEDERVLLLREEPPKATRDLSHLTVHLPSVRRSLL